MQIPIRYFTASEIDNAISHSQNELEIFDGRMVAGSMDKRLVFVRFFPNYFRNFFNTFRAIAITAQMSHLKNVLRLVGCCLQFEEAVMVYEYVEAITLSDLLFREGDHKTERSLSWGKRLRIANERYKASQSDDRSEQQRCQNNTLLIVYIITSGELEVQDAVPCGTFWYLDPEYASLGIVTQKTDVYSFGVLLFQLLTGKESLDSMQSNIDEGNVIDRVDSRIMKKQQIL
nr:non-functional pseudokinase ZED1-like [Solanum lycopersicum]